VFLPIEGIDLDLARGGAPVLVVDADSSLRSLARLALEGAGRPVLTASTAEMARLTVESQPALAAVVLDNQYGSVDLLPAIRARRADLPVILTGDSRPADQHRLGPHTVLLLKPFTIAELVEKVDAVCQNEAAEPTKAAGG
jgi:DNA-binding response OmpR family regulator